MTLIDAHEIDALLKQFHELCFAGNLCCVTPFEDRFDEAAPPCKTLDELLSFLLDRRREVAQKMAGRMLICTRALPR